MTLGLFEDTHSEFPISSQNILLDINTFGNLGQRAFRRDLRAPRILR